MQNLVKFLSILQLTREQPMYGYFLSGIKRHETSNLAEHHYLSAMIAWMLCEHVNREEKLINTDHTIKLALVHDLGELFGGDIAGPLSRRKPEMRAHAKEIEKANLEILTSFLSDPHSDEFKKLHTEFEAHSSDEAVMANIADKIEHQFFLDNRENAYLPHSTFYRDHVKPLADRLKNERTRARVHEFFTAYEELVRGKGFNVVSDWIYNQ